LSITTSYIIIVALLVLLLCFEVVRSIRKAVAQRERKQQRKWMPLYEKLEKSYEWERLSKNIGNTKLAIIKGRSARVRWDASPSPNVVGYKLYWAVGGGVNYDSESAEVGNVTEVVLPDQVTSFPLFPGNVEIGVTAVNELGKESDMTKYTAIFGSKLQRPQQNPGAND
jgi:hypothetical protein